MSSVKVKHATMMVASRKNVAPMDVKKTPKHQPVEDTDQSESDQDERPFQQQINRHSKSIRNEKKYTLGHTPYTEQRMIRTKMCRYNPCTMGEKCTFAHSLAELQPLECQFGNRCQWQETCAFLHPGETKSSLIERIYQEYLPRKQVVAAAKPKKQVNPRFIPGPGLLPPVYIQALMRPEPFSDDAERWIPKGLLDIEHEPTPVAQPAPVAQPVPTPQPVPTVAQSVPIPEPPAPSPITSPPSCVHVRVPKELMSDMALMSHLVNLASSDKQQVVIDFV